ncbi:MAG TPA: SGNH/GDSL hydrolase family protein [Dehalococcoidia bacterium]|nr:SGNH/GDSL hydrolase family protein [Dehalococcoidia bacterium]
MPKRWLLWPALLLLLLASASACGSSEEHGRGLYIALGDSISFGRGADDPSSDAFVPRVHRYLGSGFLLLNIAHSGDTSAQIRNNGQLDRALTEIRTRNGDSDPDNDVRYITLTVGGNDLLQLFFNLVLTGRCTALTDALNRADCRDPLVAAIAAMRENVGVILSSLRQAGPSVKIIMVTLYDPLANALPSGVDLAEMALEGRANTPFADGANDVLRQAAAANGVLIAEVHTSFFGRADDLIAADHIHPNNEGHKLIADAVIDAIKKAS